MFPRLTIGMATMNDFDGVYFTIMALNMYHHRDPQEIEIIVVDQSNSPSHQQMVQGVCANARAHYVPFPQPQGTSQSRNEVFRRATGDFVLCIDSHVFLAPNSIERLLNFISKAGDDLYSGPMLMDSGVGICTHFNPEWRSEMFGTWGRAWRCRCRNFDFSMKQVGEHAHYLAFPTCEKEIDACPKCSLKFPKLGWAGHEQALMNMGHYSLGVNPNDPPFEIPGQGLGVFGCLRKAWLGFPPECRGFGGEELNIHELYRQKGNKAICLPFLQWQHRFGRPAGVPYKLDRYDKARNYVIWHKLLGKPLDDIKTHFVDSRMLTPNQWDHLITDPVLNTDPPLASGGGCGTCGGNLARPQDFKDIPSAFEFVSKIDRDFNQHMIKLRQLADQCEHVTEFSIRRESTIALAASNAKMVVSRNPEQTDSLVQDIKKIRGDSLVFLPREEVPEILPTDLLFLNDRHTGERVMYQLMTFVKYVKHYIVLHNSQIYGEQGEDGKPGIMAAARTFMRSNPEWSVVFHTTDQYGFTVLSRDPADKKQLPGFATKIVNFASALAAHISDGMQKTPLPIMEQRLDICSGCDQRSDGHCAACGCPLGEKTAMASSYCPLGFWTPYHASEQS